MPAPAEVTPHRQVRPADPPLLLQPHLLTPPGPGTRDQTQPGQQSPPPPRLSQTLQPRSRVPPGGRSKVGFPAGHIQGAPQACCEDPLTCCSRMWPLALLGLTGPDLGSPSTQQSPLCSLPLTHSPSGLQGATGDSHLPDPGGGDTVQAAPCLLLASCLQDPMSTQVPPALRTRVNVFHIPGLPETVSSDSAPRSPPSEDRPRRAGAQQASSQPRRSQTPLLEAAPQSLCGVCLYWGDSGPRRKEQAPHLSHKSPL